MPTFTYPGPEFPADPSVTLTPPEGWQTAAAPGTRLAIALDQPAGVFRPSVAVLISRHSAGYEATLVLDELARLAPELADGRLEQPFHVDLDGRRFDGQILVYRQEQAGTLAELHMVSSIDHDGLTDVVHLVGTCAGDRVEEHLPMLRDVVSTVRITV